MARQGDHLHLERRINRHRKTMGLKATRDVWRHLMGPDTIVASDRAIAELHRGAACLNDQRIRRRTKATDREIGKIDGLEATVREIEKGVTPQWHYEVPGDGAQWTPHWPLVQCVP